MHQSETIQDQSIETVILKSFKSQENNARLKLKYLSWLNDKENTRLIGSKTMHETIFDKEYIEESFRRFSTNSCHGFFIYSKTEAKYIGTVKLDSLYIVCFTR